MLPRGDAFTACVVLVPPRLIEPPRPWKKVRCTPNSLATSSSSTCACCSPQRDAAMPPSLPLSEYPSITICTSSRAARWVR
ncbi:hypothetical protein D3C71_1351990 [compost metagenome]